MATMNISITTQLDRFVRDKVKSGLYNNSSEVVREGLRLLRQRDESEQLKLEILRREVRNGIEAGDKGSYATQTLDELAAEEQANYVAG